MGGSQQGIKRALERDIAHNSNVINVAIQGAFHDGPAAQIASEKLMESHKCFNAFVNWSENSFLQICALLLVTEQEAWTLVLECCWGAFFESCLCGGSEPFQVVCGIITLNSSGNIPEKIKRTALCVYWVIELSNSKMSL